MENEKIVESREKNPIIMKMIREKMLRYFNSKIVHQTCGRGKDI